MYALPGANKYFGIADYPGLTERGASTHFVRQNFRLVDILVSRGFRRYNRPDREPDATSCRSIDKVIQVSNLLGSKWLRSADHRPDARLALFGDQLDFGQSRPWNSCNRLSQDSLNVASEYCLCAGMQKRAK
jgi:hypothetical protein